ncbi:MAG: hydantoinase B/oxoprolinase family protein [Candidatus Rokubacteria bacterium]|nr:hydantoinase B/oxoprolinase family protein [Candidatus Rokubacteria bacterium]
MSLVERDLDPITFEVVKNALDSIADQMALVLMRSAYSPIVRDSLDYSTAICDWQGRMVAQGLTTALHLGSFPFAMRNLVEKQQGLMRPGDVFLFNDPYGSGGMHLPDFYVIKPIFLGEEVQGYATTLAHHTDVGGLSPGAIAVHATEIFQEGLRIPLLRLYAAGEPNETLLAILEHNVRVPRKVLGDLRAQVAGCYRGEQAYLELLERYGVPTFWRYLEAIQAHAERVMRAEIARLPDGTYRFTDFIDGLGEHPEPIRFQVAITIKGDEAVVDWTGTSPQVKAAINAPGPFIYSATYVPFRCLAGRDIPNAEGYMRPISVVAPAGTIVNPALPAAANARGIVGFRAMDAVLGALAKAVPDRIPAGSEGGATNISIGGLSHGEPYIFAETVMGAWGGRPDREGIDGAANLAANQSNQPVEFIEADNPVEILRYGFVANSGGPGRFRGGLAIVREYRLTADEGFLTFRTDRRAHPPFGVQGGKHGTPSWNILNPGPHQRILPVLPLQGYQMRRGDVFCHLLAGAGGFGDPLVRDAARVLADVRDEKITRDYARSEYGVVIRPRTLALDDKATAALRQKMRRRGRARRREDTHVAHFDRALADALAIDAGPAALDGRKRDRPRGRRQTPRRSGSR